MTPVWQVKFWDADKFLCIMTIPAHHGEIWGAPPPAACAPSIVRERWLP
jgi:hypothetical protein